MSQPPPPPGNPPPPPGGYGYPAPAPGPAGDNPPPAPGGWAVPPAAPVPPAQNPYAAPTQPAFPAAQPPPPGQPAPPQGPPQAPPPAPGYGYPGAQQQPYGQQPYGQQPYGQPYPQTPPPAPGYGYPGQQPPPYQGAPAGGGRGANRMVVIVAAVVAAVLVVAGGVYFATKGGGKDNKAGPTPSSHATGTGGGKSTAAGHNPDLAFKWDKTADPVAQKDNLKDALGIWFTDKYVVKNEIDKVVAYDMTTGAAAWTIPAPSRGDCTAARDTYQDKAAIQYGPTCNKVMVIDLAAGKPLWTQDLPGASGRKTEFDYSEMAISGDTVGIDWLDGSIGYRISDQTKLWQSGNGNCEDDGYAGGKQFVAVVNCDYRTYKVQVIDPAKNGAAKWTWEAPTGTEVNAIVSTDPVVVLLGTEGTTYTDVAVLANGRLQSRVSLGTDKYHVDDDGTEKQAVHNIQVSQDTLYLTMSAKNGDKQPTSGIAAFNLSDGRQKWVAKPSGNREITAMDFADGKLLAYEPPDYDVQGLLVTLDPATGAISPYSSFPQDAYDKLGMASLHSYYVWHNGQFYVVGKTVYAGESDQKYLIVFG